MMFYFYFIVIHDPCLLTHAAPNGYCEITQNLTFTSVVTEHNVTVSIQNDNVVESLELFFANLRLLSSTNGMVINSTLATVFIRSEDRLSYIHYISTEVMNILYYPRTKNWIHSSEPYWL